MSASLKDNLQTQVQLEKEDSPLLIIVADYNSDFDKDLKKLISGLKHLPVNYRVLLVTENVENKHSNRNIYIMEKKEVVNFFKFAHMVLFFSNKPSKFLVKKAIESDAVPICYDSVSYLENYNSKLESGNAFKFKELNSWSAYATVVRALENFGFPYDWKCIIKAAKNIL